MQLSPSTALRIGLLASVIAIAAGAARSARANTAEVAARTTLFDEPSTKNQGVQVIHPQVDATATVSSTVNFALGYSADVVTGATPATFSTDTVSTATKFSDNRHLFHGGIGFERTDGGIAFAGAYGFERDYKSIVISGTTHHDLYEHNFTLALAYSHNFDTVCDADNTSTAGLPLDRVALMSSSGCFTSTPGFITHSLNIDTFEPSLSWTMTPRLVIQGGATIQILQGFQSNPYRKVQIATRTPQEHEPDNRQRYALFARLAYAFPELRASMLAMVRGYDDSWAVRAITGDLTGTKYVGQNLLFSGRAHYHQQSGASFYRDAVGYQTLGPPGQYWTGDRELSPMGNYLLGGKLAYFRRPQTERTSWFVEIELGVKYEFLLYRPDSPYGPNPDRKFAHILQGAAAMRF